MMEREGGAGKTSPKADGKTSSEMGDLSEGTPKDPGERDVSAYFKMCKMRAMEPYSLLGKTRELDFLPGSHRRTEYRRRTFVQEGVGRHESERGQDGW